MQPFFVRHICIIVSERRLLSKAKTFTNNAMLIAPTLTHPALFRRALVLACITLCLAPLRAQTAPAAGNTTTTPAATAPAASKSFECVGEAIYEHIFSGDLNSGATGKMRTDRFAIGLQHTEDWTDDHLALTLGYSYENYSFSGTQSPFSNVQKLGADVLYSHDFKPDWGAFAFLSAGHSAETATSLNDGGQFAFAAGPSYNFSKVLTLSAGPMYYSRMEDDNTWTIMAQAKWLFLPQWELRAYAGIVNGVTVSYDVFGNKATVADASLEYNSRWFRLRDTPAGKAAVNESDGTLKFGVRQALNQNVFVRGYLSYVFSREYQFHVNGNSANSFNVDSSWGLGLEIGVVY